MIAYAVTAPLILPLACAAFAVFWACNRYLILYVVSSNISTDGRLYPRALLQLLTGVYVMELYLIGLFSLRQDREGRPTSLVQTTVMATILMLTVLFHWQLSNLMGPLLRDVSLSGLKERRDATSGMPCRDQQVHHPALQCSMPTVWIPNDPVCESSKASLSDQQIQRSRTIYRGMLPMNNTHATFDEKATLHVQYWDIPQEYDVQVSPESRF